MLGAGGVTGGAWMAATLATLSRAAGWDPSIADVVLGTSAGSVMAALLASGVAAGRLVPASGPPASARLSGDGWVLADLAIGDAYRALRTRRLPGPGSLHLALHALRERAVLRAICGLVPRGLVPTAAIEATIRRSAPAGWPPRHGCWVVACDYRTGRRVVFGQEDAPRTSLASAVAASCAIPGFFEPVRVGGRLYVDGGLHSLSNLDVLADHDVDLVVALSPMSAAGARGGWSPLSRMTAAMRRRAARQVAAEAESLRRRGVEVLLLEPGDRDLEAMGPDVMDTGRVHRVADVAVCTVGERLRLPGVRRLLHRLVA